jgi:gamma-glutamylcyclotransferase (GGCT)/AIG2-like uncharacterized protein YtfP
MTKVFVYGTLKRGHCNHHLLKDARFVSKAKTTSVHVMLDGGFPYVSQATKKGPFSGQVHGEIFEVDAKTLSRLDSLEGYRPENPAASHYLRLPVEVKPVSELNGNNVERVWMYQMTDRMNKPVMAAAHSKKAVAKIADQIGWKVGRNPIKPVKGNLDWSGS